MYSTDKVIWDDVYNEDFDGLSSILTCEIISETQFKKLSKGCKPLLLHWL